MGWKIGDVANRYFVMLEGGDQMGWGLVCGLPGMMRNLQCTLDFRDVHDQLVQDAVTCTFPQIHQTL